MRSDDWVVVVVVVVVASMTSTALVASDVMAAVVVFVVGVESVVLMGMVALTLCCWYSLKSCSSFSASADNSLA